MMPRRTPDKGRLPPAVRQSAVSDRGVPVRTPLAEKDQMSKPTILAVDDDATAREALAALLANEECQTRFVDNGVDALAAAAADPPDLILLDVMMPGLDGFEVCRRLRAEPSLREVPIVLLTALDDRQSRLEGLQAGADDFLSKPYDRAELRARVRTILRLNRYRRLVDERERFRWLADHARDGYLITDEKGRVAYANEAAALFLGLDPAALPEGLDFPACAEPGYRREPVEAWASWPAPGDAPRYLVRAETPSARAFWLRAESTEIAHDTGAGRLVLLRDVTDEKSAGRDVRTLQTLVAHKFRTPLSGLIGSLHVLASDNLEPKERTEFSRTAVHSAERLAAQLERILMAVRKRGAAEPACPLSVVPVVVREITIDLGLAKVPEVPLEPSVGWRRLRLGVRSFEWILRELFENSVKFHPTNSPAIEVSVQVSGPAQVTVSVSDDGIHLSPEQLLRAAWPYAQGAKYETGETPGMGLGLPVVAARLWEVGGSLSLRNRREKPGVVVEVVIPTDEPPGA